VIPTSLREVLGKATLRAYVAVLTITSLVAIVLYIIFRADVRVGFQGSIDIGQLMTAFITIISVVIGWLFGRQQQ